MVFAGCLVVAASALPAAADPGETCLRELRTLGVTFSSLPALPGTPPCGTEQPLRVEALPDGVALRPAATLTCAMARSLAGWSRDVLVPAAREHLDKVPTALRVAGSYVCRRVNGAPRAKLSQHAYANAIDIGGVVLEDEATIQVSYRGHARLPAASAYARFQRDLRAGACKRFATVIGPGGDAFHGDHFHFDLRQRPGDRKVCD